jgi:hypothetical protein
MDDAMPSLSQWMPKSRPTTRLEPKSMFPIVVSRLFDHELALLHDFSRYVKRDWLCRFRRMGERRFALPHVRVAVEHLFGATSRSFDDYKGSFAFPLLLQANRPAGRARYIVRMADVRGRIDLEFFKIRMVPNADVDDAPGTEEPPSVLTLEELEHLGEFIRGYLEGMGEVLIRMAEPFLHVVESELLVYGCEDGKPFEYDYDTREAYDEQLAKIRDRLGPAERGRARAQLDALLESCGDPPG